MIKNKINNFKKKYSSTKKDSIIVVQPSFGNIPSRPYDSVKSINISSNILTNFTIN